MLCWRLDGKPVIGCQTSGQRKNSKCILSTKNLVLYTHCKCVTGGKSRKSTLTTATCFPTICAYFTHTHISAHLVWCCLRLKPRNEFPCQLLRPGPWPSRTRYTGVTVFDNSAARFHPVTSDTATFYPVGVILWVPLKLH